MKRIVSFFIAALALALSAPAFAVNHHICRCDTGAVPGCVAGSTSGTGTASDPYLNPTQIPWNSLNNDRVLHCNGGWFETYSVTISQTTRDPATTAYDRVVVSNYESPHFASGGVLPMLRIGSGSAIVQFGAFGHNEACALPSTGHCDGGYTISNLRLQCKFINYGDPGANVSGIWIWHNLHHLDLDNIEISGCQTGFKPQHSEASDGLMSVFKIRLRNSRIFENCDHGILGTATDFVLLNNDIEDNNTACGESGAGGGGQHGWYATGVGAARVTAMFNRFRNNSRTESGCAGGNVTFHGNTIRFIFKGNLIYQDMPLSANDCYGLSMTAGHPAPEEEYCLDCEVTQNTFVNLANGVCANLAPGLIVENNLFVNVNFGMAAGCTGGPWNSGYDAVMTAYVFRHNGCYYTTAATFGTCFTAADTQVTSDVVVHGNIAVYAGTTGTRRCFVYDQTSATYADTGENICWGFSQWMSASLSSLAQMQAAGFETGSIHANPLVTEPTAANGWVMSLGAGSPAIGAASLASAPDLDARGCTRPGKQSRPGTPAIGPFDYYAAPCTPVPARAVSH